MLLLGWLFAFPSSARTWATPSVGNAEGLVQVQVAHVCANDAGGCEAHLHGGKVKGRSVCGVQQLFSKQYSV